MRFLASVAAVIFLLSLVGVVEADQAQSREQPVTHLVLPACKAEDMKLLAARRKLSNRPTKLQHVGKWLIAEWQRLPVSVLGVAEPSQLSGDNLDITSRDLIEIYPAGSDPRKDCQFLVAGDPGPPNAIVEWQRRPLRDEARPQFILGSYSGGVTGCCWTNYVVSLGEALAVDRLSPIYGTEGQKFSLTFSEKNPDVPPDLRLLDFTFFGWPAGSPGFGAAAFYTLTWQSDRYVLEWPARAPSPSNADMERWRREMAATISRLPDKEYSSSVAVLETGNDPYFWQHPLDLIYAGYTDMAVDLLNKAWPKDIRGKDLFWQDFRKQLQQYSVIWDARHLDQVLPRHLPAKS